MTKNYDEVCVELDTLSMRMLDLMKEYMDCKIIIENYIKTGSLHLAKARYIMGNKSVSSLQLPTGDCDVQAGTRVSHSKSASMENLIFEINRISLENNGNPMKHAFDKSQKDVNVEKESNNSKGKKVNKRTKKSEDNKSSDSTDQPKNLTVTKDPLKWFGVLVPQNLKHAQTNFNTAIDYVIQCANIQIEMESVRSKYQVCLQLKKEFKTS